MTTLCVISGMDSIIIVLLSAQWVDDLKGDYEVLTRGRGICQSI